MSSHLDLNQLSMSLPVKIALLTRSCEMLLHRIPVGGEHATVKSIRATPALHALAAHIGWYFPQDAAGSVEESVHLLDAGDSFSFRSHLQHLYANLSEREDTLVVWANTLIALRK